MYVKIYYSAMNGSAICYETFDLDEYIENREAIHQRLLSYDEDPMDLDVQLFDSDGLFIADLNDENSLTDYLLLDNKVI